MRELNVKEIKQVSGGNALLKWFARAIAADGGKGGAKMVDDKYSGGWQG